MRLRLPRSSSQPVPAGMTDLRLRALQLLTRREHSRAELHAKLAPQAESAEALAVVLDGLEQQGLLSDNRYARQRVVARAGRYGNARLRQELKQRGIDESEIEAALPEAGDEAERCQSIWARKFGRPPETSEERAKQMRFLQYRGFSHETIRRVLRGVEDE